MPKCLQWWGPAFCIWICCLYWNLPSCLCFVCQIPCLRFILKQARLDKAVVFIFSAVTLFELTVVNDWYIIMVSKPQLPRLPKQHRLLPDELDLFILSLLSSPAFGEGRISHLLLLGVCCSWSRGDIWPLWHATRHVFLSNLTSLQAGFHNPDKWSHAVFQLITLLSRLCSLSSNGSYSQRP